MIKEIGITAAAMAVIIAIIVLLARRYLRQEDSWEEKLSRELDNRPWLDYTDRMENEKHQWCRERGIDDTDRMATNTDILFMENEKRQWWRERAIEAQAAVIVNIVETDQILESGYYAYAFWLKGESWPFREQPLYSGWN